MGGAAIPSKVVKQRVECRRLSGASAPAFPEEEPCRCWAGGAGELLPWPTRYGILHSGAWEEFQVQSPRNEWKQKVGKIKPLFKRKTCTLQGFICLSGSE